MQSILNSIYSGWVLALTKKAYINRKSEEIEDKKGLIEITPKLNFVIDEVIVYKVKDIVRIKMAGRA